MWLFLCLDLQTVQCAGVLCRLAQHSLGRQPQRLPNACGNVGDQGRVIALPAARLRRQVCVLFSGKIKNPVTEFTEGLNTYRIMPIIMADWNADEFLIELRHKIDKNEKITKEELIRLVLMPLMGGESAQKERITGAFRIIEKAKDISEEDIRRLEAMIYTMADKFLEKIDLDEVRSEMRMTELGKMLYEEAEKKVKLESAKNLLGILNDELIAEKIGIPLEDVLKLKEEMK